MLTCFLQDKSLQLIKAILDEQGQRILEGDQLSMASRDQALILDRADVPL